jgi:hypothetical protein
MQLLLTALASAYGSEALAVPNRSLAGLKRANLAAESLDRRRRR